MPTTKRWEHALNLLTENKDMKKMFSDLSKLQKEMEALQKRMNDLKINFK
ncbi:hypothetical protein LJK88_31430 [Paenibacillus sp. P26]|nr:hypothetical protein LJK88_31430 [Paenibacillus sp. P26]UUZ94271.1 hypothetical protein LJK87_06645 [Paenibacillus sp. P25]